MPAATTVLTARAADPSSPVPKTNLQPYKKHHENKMPKVQGAVTVDEARCKGCELCVVACPADVLSLQPKEVNDRGYHFAFAAKPDNCIGCAACATVCPDACIEVYRVVLK